MSNATTISSNSTHTTFFIRYSELLSRDSIINATINAANFTWNRFPNIDEFTTVIIPNSLIQTFMSPLTNKFGQKHPTELSAFRDTVKLFGALLAAEGGVEIGSTGVTYDIGNVVGSSRKAGYKMAMLLVGTHFGLSKDNMEKLALTANFAGEPFARYEKIISRGWQINCKNKKGCDMTRSEYSQLHSSDATKRALIESPAKTFTSDIMAGYTFKPLFGKITDKTDFYANKMLSYGCKFLIGSHIADFGKARGPYEKAARCVEAGKVVSLITKYEVSLLYFSIEGSARIIIEFSKSLIFVPIVSSVSDGPIADWLFGSTVVAGTTISGTVATYYCLLSAHVSNPLTYKDKGACAALGVMTKVGLDGVAYYTPAIDHVFGSGAKLTTTLAGVFALTQCMKLEQPIKSACMVAAPISVLVINAFDITEFSSVQFLSTNIKSTLTGAANLIHDCVETPIVNVLYTLTDIAKEVIRGTSYYVSPIIEEIKINYDPQQIQAFSTISAIWALGGCALLMPGVSIFSCIAAGVVTKIAIDMPLIDQPLETEVAGGNAPNHSEL